MRKTFRSGAWIRFARIAALATGVLALTSCAAGYSFVQPGATGAGSYYTSDGPYPAPGYYYYDGISAYDPYGAGFGYGSLYGPSFTFGLGLGSACGWSCAGYYGGWPWYYGGIGYYGRRRHHGHHHHGDPVASGPSPRPWLRPDHARVPPPHLTRGATPPIAVPERPMESLTNRRALDSASFAPRGIERMPRPAGLADRPAYMTPQSRAFVERPMPIQTATAHDFARPAAPAAAPMHAAPPPPTRSSHATSVKIP